MQALKKYPLAGLLGLVACLGLGHAPAAVVMNEILADNRDAVENAGDSPDYVELFNTASTSADLSGMSLTDDPALPRRFIFPAGTVVVARGYLLVWCDSQFTQPGLHTGFGLAAAGERLRLYAADGVTVRDEVLFGLQAQDLSISRVPDGGPHWELSRPTARAANVAVVLAAPLQLHLNEWMAQPASGDDWIEVFNSASQPVRLSGLVPSDTFESVPLNRPIPPLSFIGPYGYVVFQATNLERPDADHLDFKLSASGEVLTLYHSNRTTIIDRVSFGRQTTDVSQGRVPDGSPNIAFFPAGRSTPGTPNVTVTPLTNVVISEVLAHTDLPLEDAIELHNPTANSVNISHWWLSDSASNPQKFRLPAGTTLAPGGFKVFYQYQFDSGPHAFGLNSAVGEQIFLSTGDAVGRLTGPQTSLRIGPSRNGVSFGRHSTSAGTDFVPLSRRTFGVDDPGTVAEFRQGQGGSNALPRVGPIVISELMFHPAGGGGTNTDDEYLELYNPTSEEVTLYDRNFPENRWKLIEGINFQFPPWLVVPPHGYLLVVGFDPAAEPVKRAAFCGKYAVPAHVPLVGPYTGSLSDLGEPIQVVWPDLPEIDPGTGDVFVPYEHLERVRYASGAPWPTGAAGTGRSLQRRVMLDYGNEPLNWFTSQPTAGRRNLIDTDGDGMADVWERAYGLNPNWNGDAEQDADGDRASNLAEFIGGTHPLDAASVLRITAISREAERLRFSFIGVAERCYAIQARSDWPASPWTTVTNFPPALTAGPVEVVFPAAALGFTCFRVMVSPAE